MIRVDAESLCIAHWVTRAWRLDEAQHWFVFFDGYRCETAVIDDRRYPRPRFLAPR